MKVVVQLIVNVGVRACGSGSVVAQTEAVELVVVKRRISLWHKTVEEVACAAKVNEDFEGHDAFTRLVDLRR